MREVSWQGETDAVVAWGGALGLNPFSVASLGPGYDHHAGREPLVVDREGGAFYGNGFSASTRADEPPSSRWRRGTNSTKAPTSVTPANTYIALTAEYAARYKAEEHLRIEGVVSNADLVEWVSSGEPKGSTLRCCGDGVMETVDREGISAHRTAPNRISKARYASFDLDPAWAFNAAEGTYRVEVEYLDRECDAFELHDDSQDNTSSAREGAFKLGGRVSLGNTDAWRIATFDLPDARFADRRNGADFRLAALGGTQERTLRRVTVRRGRTLTSLFPLWTMKTP